MEVPMQMNHNLAKRVPPSHAVSPRYSSKPMMITCQVTMQSGQKNSNFYQLLSLKSHNVGSVEIKKAYRKMALLYHPDVCTNSLTKEESAQRFIELRKAYETLSDPDSRRIYDCKLELEDPSGSRFREKRKEGSFSREVLGRQLHGLRKRSLERMWRKMGTYE